MQASDAETYDFIVVGAGSAGSAVRTDYRPTRRTRSCFWRPAPPATLVTHPARLCQAAEQSEGELALSIGGRWQTQTAVRFMCRAAACSAGPAPSTATLVRGQAQDFDAWAQMGNRGWSYKDVCPSSKDGELRERGGDDEFRGGEARSGSQSDATDPLLAAIIRAAGQVGIEHNPDYNGARQDGISDEPGDDLEGPAHEHRALAYLDPIRSRPNLRIVTEALTKAVLLDGKRCTGVPGIRSAARHVWRMPRGMS